MSGSQKKYEQIGVAMTCRSYEEYERMFAFAALTAESGPVLDVSSGASSFVAEACSRGIRAVAVDPLYDLQPEDIYRHGAEEIETSTNKLSKLVEHFDWTFYGSLPKHRAKRERSLERFIADYRSDQHKRSKYIAAKLPDLPFADNAFGLVLCSHFLFLYHEQFDYTFHLNAITELLRVCRPGGEVRIYPVYTLGWDRYPHLELLLDELPGPGVAAEIIPSELPFIPGSSELLRLKKHM